AVGVEAAGIKNRFFGAEKFCQYTFQFLMAVLGAANETHARHAEAVSIEGLLGRGDERWVIGQAEVIVRAEIENALAPRDGNVCVLRRGNNPLSFVKTLRFDFI